MKSGLLAEAEDSIIHMIDAYDLCVLFLRRRVSEIGRIPSDSSAKQTASVAWSIAVGRRRAAASEQAAGRKADVDNSGFAIEVLQCLDNVGRITGCEGIVNHLSLAPGAHQAFTPQNRQLLRQG